MPLHTSAQISLPTAVIVLTTLFLHAQYVTRVTEPTTNIPAGETIRSVYNRAGDGHGELPDLFVFRRTKKTASTSMANALLTALIPLGYEPLAMKNFEISTAAANAFLRASPRRLLIINHNQVTRAAHPMTSTFSNSFPKQSKVPKHSPLKSVLRQQLSMFDRTDDLAGVKDDEDSVTPAPTPEVEEDEEDDHVPHVYYSEGYARARVVIADTVRDGFSQITSYCRHMRGFDSCNATLIPCIQSRLARTQMLYRFAGAENETADTYIDLPLSSAHPALSTTVLRTVYPEIGPLRVDRYNARRYACRRKPELLTAYRSAGFDELDRHVDMLRRRMLVIAGYPTAVRMAKSGRSGSKGVEGDSGEVVSTAQLLDAAEALERKRKFRGVSFYARPVSPFSKSAVIAQLLARPAAWTRDGEGRIELMQRRSEIQVDESEKRKAQTW